MRSLRLVLLTTVVAGLATLAGCGVGHDPVVARSDVVVIEAGGTVDAFVLENDLVGPDARITAVGRASTDAISFTVAGDHVVIRAEGAKPGDEFVVDYVLRSRGVVDSAPLVVRVADDSATSTSTSLTTTTTDPQPRPTPPGPIATPSPPTPPEPIPGPPKIGVAPLSVRFGSVDQGAPIESITVKVDNTGTTAVTMIVSSPDAPFSVVNSTCGTLRPDQSCRIEVGATTTNIGTYQETLTIKAADLQRSANVNVPVSLTVTPRAPVTDFEFRPKTVTLADDSPTARITLTNTGTTVIDELSRDIEPEKVRVPNTTCVSPNPRALASNRGKLPLAPGESCTFDLLLVDRSPGSEAIEELSITARDVTRTLEIRIDTTVSDRAQITLGPSSIDVSPRESFEVTVTNTGTVALTGLSVGDYAPTAGGPGTRGFRSDCRDDLGVRESCRIVMAVYRQGDSADPLLAGTITVGFGEASADLTVAVDDVPSEPQLPDLSVGFEPDSSFDVACYGASDPTHSGTVILCDLRIVVLVHNAGPGSSPANEVRVTADQHGTRVFSIGALQAGETERYTFLLDGGGNCYDPDCTVSLAVNPNGSVAERREDNNTDVRTITG